MRAGSEPTDQDLVEGIRRSCQLLERRKSFLVTVCQAGKKPDGTDNTVLSFVDPKNRAEKDGSYLIVDRVTDEIVSVVRYGQGPPIFPVPPGKKVIVGRQYLMFRMGKA